MTTQTPSPTPTPDATTPPTGRVVDGGTAFIDGVIAYRGAVLVTLAASWTVFMLAVICAGIGAVLGALSAPLALLHPLGTVFGTSPYATGLDGPALALAAAGGAVAGATAGFTLVVTQDPLPTLATALGGITGGAILAWLVVSACYDGEEEVLRPRGDRSPVWEEKERLDPLLTGAGAALGLDVDTLPPVLVRDSSIPTAWACMRVVVVTRGLLETLDDEELASILAHELAHWMAGHPMGQRFVWAAGLPLVLAQKAALVLTTSQSRILAAVGWTLFWPVLLTVRIVIAPYYAEHQRACEFAADDAVTAAGPLYREGLKRALRKLSILETPQSSWEAALTRSHPPTPVRIDRLISPEEAARRKAIRAQEKARRRAAAARQHNPQGPAAGAPD